METTGPAKPLYSRGHVLLAAFLGSPVAGAYFMSRNEIAWGAAKKASSTLWIGAAITIALFATAFLLPADVPGMPIAMAGVFGVLAWYQNTQEARFKEHIAAGAVAANWGRTVGISLLFLVGVLALTFMVAMLLPEDMLPE
jgi:hypothetical protein